MKTPKESFVNPKEFVTSRIRKDRCRGWLQRSRVPAVLPCPRHCRLLLEGISCWKRLFSMFLNTTPEALLPLHSWSKKCSCNSSFWISDIFSSLSSNRAERAVPLKWNQTIRRAFTALPSDVAGKESVSACFCCFDYLSAWPGFISVAYQMWVAITDLEIRRHEPAFALL